MATNVSFYAALFKELGAYMFKFSVEYCINIFVNNFNLV